MLTEIRDRSSGVFAWFIAALIIIPMAFFGVSQYASTEARPTVVQVGDQKITQQEYQARLTAAQNQARERNPNFANNAFLNSDAFKKQVLQGMVQSSLTKHVAEQYDYRVSEAQVDQIIRENPTFQTDGKFDQSIYDAFTASRGRAGSAQLKSDIAAGFRTQQVASGYQESALVLPNEVRGLLEIQAEERTFDIITVKQSDFNDSVTVSEADIAAYYEANTDDFMLADRTSVSYIELDKAQIASGVTIDDSIVQANYDDYVNSYVADETRLTSHILLNVDDDNSNADQLAKAQDIITQLNAGADFAALAKQYSQDPGSANNGGSLGDVERGQMVPEFEEATFSLAQGVVSEPVKTQFGYHIIKVDKINATEPQSFAELRFQLEQEERDRLAEEQIVEQAEQLRNVLFEQADSLQAASELLSLPIKTSSLFSRDAGTGIASNDLIRAAAFSDAVLNEDLNSELIEISDGVFVALRKLDFAASEPKKLAVVSNEIKTKLINERASAAAKEAGDKFLERVNNDWEVLQADESVEINTHTISLIDTERKVPTEVLQEVIKLRLNDGAPVVHSFTGANGDFNIVRLNNIKSGDLSAVSQQVKDATRSLIEQRNGQSLLSSYLQGLNENLASDINEDLL